MLPGDYLLRRPSPDDRPGLAALATALWGPGESQLFSRRWWWNDAEPHCWIAEHRPSGAVAAICAQRRSPFMLAGRTLTSSTVSDWYVAPDHAGAGLGQALVRRGEGRSAFMYTSAISDSAATGFTRLGWSGDHRVPMSVGLVPLAARLAGRGAAGVDVEHRTVSSAAPGDLAPLDALWQGLRRHATATVIRDADHLRGHLSLAGGRPYSLLVARRQDRPSGYLLCRTLPPRALRAFGPVRVGIVSDYLVDDEDVQTLRVLIGAACRRWSAEGVRVVLALTGSDRHRAALSRLGLVGPVTVGGRTLGARMTSRVMYQPKPGSEGSWHLTFADNDTDLILGVAGAPPS